MGSAGVIAKRSFAEAPGAIDFFISHPLLSQAAASKAVLLVQGIALCAILYFILSAVVKKKKILRCTLISGVICLFTLILNTLAAQAKTAVQPTSATIIAAIISDKATVNGLFSKKYYLITDIGGKACGVVTNKESYLSPRYSPGATFDYSLYTYVDGERITMYRFLKPEYKLKAEPGNLQ